jgi:thymidine phosphorylase
MEDDIDHVVGVVCLAKRGDRVEPGQPLAEVHAREEHSARRGVAEVQACYRVGADAPEPRSIVLDVLS